MQSKKTQKHIGQRPLISEYDEEPPADKRPKGMPALLEVQAEVTRLGLPKSDAEDIYLSWAVNGFKTGGQSIRSWKAQVFRWFRNGYFPSQKRNGAKVNDGELMTYEKLDELASWTAFKKLDVHRLGAEFREWCEKNQKPKLVSSFMKLLNAKL